MSLATTIGAGTLLGGLLAVGVYSALAPADTVNASTPGAPTYGPVPTRTVEVEAEDCVGKAVLEGDECVLHVPGPTVTLPAATTERSEESRSSSGATSAPRTAPTYADDESESDDDSGYESEDSGEDESQEDAEHEDAEHEEEHDDGGEYGDD